MRIVIQHDDDDDMTAQWLADAIQTTFSSLVTEVAVARNPKPLGEPFAVLQDLSGILGADGGICDSIIQSIAGAGSLLYNWDLSEVIKGMEELTRAIEAANVPSAQAISSAAQPADVHAGISGDLVPHSEVFARTDQGREYLAAATFNPVLPHANQPVRLSITAD